MALSGEPSPPVAAAEGHGTVSKRPRIGVFPATALAAEGFRGEAMAAFYRGLVAAGEDAVLVEGAGYEPCDVAVVMGVAKPEKRAAHLDARAAIREAHRGVSIHLETPFLGRSVYSRERLIDRWLRPLFGRRLKHVNRYGYFRVGIGGVFPDEADYVNRDSPPDRWQRLAREFGIALAPWRRSGQHVLVVGQMPGDASLRGTDILAWMEEVIATLRRHTDRPILVRPHPLTNSRQMEAMAGRLRGLKGVTVDFPPDGPIGTALQGAWASVTFSSTAAVDSLLAGVPAFSFSPVSIAWPVTGHDLARIEDPEMPPREPWLHDLAYAQWSPTEMQAGVVWQRLRGPVLDRLAARG